MSKNDDRIRVGISVGDINGIGLEVIMKTFSDPRMLQKITPIIYGSNRALSYHRKSLNIQDFNYHSIKDTEKINPKKINVVSCWEEEVKIQFGKASQSTGKYALKSLEAATQDLAQNRIDVLVTAPIDKHSIQSKDFTFNGHTEYLAKLSNVNDALMMMVSNDLKVAVATGHIPLKEVSEAINADLLWSKISILHNSLIKDFNIVRPKIAVFGVNPHAGEKGLLGKEEEEIIIPVINKAKGEGMLVFGPYPADGFFGSSTFKNFDGILAMYHDQGLVPFKALSFGSGVNYTAGLPIVRTSPDHGTAYELAGKNLASPSSFRNAVFLACDIFENRKQQKELHADPLVKQNAEEQ